MKWRLTPNLDIAVELVGFEEKTTLITEQFGLDDKRTSGSSVLRTFITHALKFDLLQCNHSKLVRRTP